MSGTLRRAQLRDLSAIIALKTELRLCEGRSSAGGFLLGTTPDVYAEWIRTACFWVLEFPQGVSGFAIGLADETLRQSAIWTRRRELDCDPAFIAGLESKKIGYFEQLAVARDAASRRFAALLAMRVCDDLFGDGHEHIVTTTVREPVTNRAAWPFLRRAGATLIGTIDEVYPEAGAVRSDVHVIDAVDFRQAVTEFWGRSTTRRERAVAGTR